MLDILGFVAYVVWEAAFWVFSFVDGRTAVKWLCAIAALALICGLALAALKPSV